MPEAQFWLSDDGRRLIDEAEAIIAFEGGDSVRASLTLKKRYSDTPPEKLNYAL